jgi:hypothetical protein
MVGAESSRLARCASSDWPGSTITVASEPGARSSQVFVPSSVIGPGLLCSRTEAYGVTSRTVS